MDSEECDLSGYSDAGSADYDSFASDGYDESSEGFLFCSGPDSIDIVNGFVLRMTPDDENDAERIQTFRKIEAKMRRESQVQISQNRRKMHHDKLRFARKCRSIGKPDPDAMTSDDEMAR